MTIKNVARVLLDRDIKRAQSEVTKKNRGGDSVKGSTETSVDSAQISSEAKEVNASQFRLANGIDSVSITGKAENIEEVKERISSGFYETAEVLEEIASSIIKTEGIRADEDGPDKFEIFRERIKSDFYENKDVIDTAASRLLKYLK